MSKYIEIENTETLVEAQLQIGKKGYICLSRAI